jgi:AAHS family 4-hydroxybenzoate transporter-like MFS transporter
MAPSASPAAATEADVNGGPGRIDVDARIDAQALGPRHYVVAVLAFLVLVVDGYDLSISAQMLPAIAHSFGVASAPLLQAYALQMVGTAIGALALSPVADHVGRRPVLLGSLVAFAIVTLACAAARDVLLFVWLRAATGLIGGVLTPVVVSLLADVFPARWRATYVGVVYTGLTVGPLLSTQAVGWLLEPFGWASCFWAGGLLTLALIPFVWALLPESPRHLAARDPSHPGLHRALRLSGVAVDPEARVFSTYRPSSPDVPVVSLFQQRRAVMTLVVWSAAILSLSAGSLSGLLPTLFHDLAHIPVARFARAFSLTFIGSLPAAFTVGLIMDRVGPYKTIFGFFLGAGLAFIGLITAPFGTPAFYVLLFCAGVCSTAAIQGLNILTPALYPPRMRAAAVGWKGGVSRLSSAITPMLGIAILGSGWGLGAALAMIGAPYLAGAACFPILFLAVRGRGHAGP